MPLHRPKRGIEAGKVVVENKVREGDGDRDIDSLDKMEAADGQEEDLAGAEDEIQNLRFLEPGVRRGRRDTANLPVCGGGVLPSRVRREWSANR